jgi:hypothetical protein
MGLHILVWTVVWSCMFEMNDTTGDMYEKREYKEGVIA